MDEVSVAEEQDKIYKARSGISGTRLKQVKEKYNEFKKKHNIK